MNLINNKQAAEMLGLSKKELTALVDLKEGPPVYGEKGNYWYVKEEVEEFAKKDRELLTEKEANAFLGFSTKTRILMNYRCQGRYSIPVVLSPTRVAFYKKADLVVFNTTMRGKLGRPKKVV